MSRLYVGRLPRDVRERDIERLFKDYGQIRDICLLSGFGFVEFRDRRDAEDVMHDFNNREFMGERLLIEPARVERRSERGDRGDRGGERRPERGDFGRREERGARGARMGGPMSAPQRTPFRMLVENLSSSVSWQDLKDFARRAGEVSFADAHKLRPGEGIIEFIDESGLRNALRKLDGEELRGRRVVLREDPASRGADRGARSGPRDRSFSPRRARRHSRSRSRSRSPAGNGRRSGGYRSRSPAGNGRRMSRRSVSRDSRSISRSPRDERHGADVHMAPPMPHSPHSRGSVGSPRSPRSPRSPMSPGFANPDLGGEIAPEHSFAPPAPVNDVVDNGAGQDGWE